MNEAELAKHTTCSLCSRLVTQSGLPLFWVVRVERHGIDAQATRRAVGLSSMVGSWQIAQAMGLDEDLTKPLMDPVTLTLCETCATERGVPIAALAMP